MINVAIIGSGIWSRINVEIYSEMIKKFKENGKNIPQIELLGYWSNNEAEKNEFQKKYSIKKTYKSINEVLNDDNIDLVEICGSEENRSKIAIKAIKMGKHVSIAPPPGFDLIEIKELINFVKKNSSKSSFRIINPLKNSSQFQKILDFIKKNKLGKIFAINIASFTRGDPELNLFDDTYSIAEIMNTLLGKIDLLMSWTPKGFNGKFTNKNDINCNLVPKNNSKHGTWTHRCLPNLKIRGELLYNEYTFELVFSDSLLFSYGATGELFNSSPISSGPGIYWCHQEDHKWKSDLKEQFSHKDYMTKKSIEFINSIIRDKKPKIDYKNILDSSKIVNCIISSILKNGDPIKTKDASGNVFNLLRRELS